jgi:molecular chaperone HtpG
VSRVAATNEIPVKVVLAMARIAFPSAVLATLTESQYGSAVLKLRDAVGELAHDNKTPLFPAYTDHGTDHLQRVFEDALRLVPPAVGARLAPADYVVLAGAVLLHDLGMHLTERGFAALVTPETQPPPLTALAGLTLPLPPDQPWSSLWEAFQVEIRHGTRSKLDAVLGPDHEGIPAVAFAKEGKLDPDTWTTSDRLVAGEFIRRHHARLAHEIAMYGFPGLGPEHFPVLAAELPELAPLTGLVARSHHLPIRLAADISTALHPGTKRPYGAAVVYHMALLRIADFVQLDVGRAPAALLKLKNPQSPVSVLEWQKHAGVVHVEWDDNDDDRAIYFGIAHDHPLRVHLALHVLLDTLRHELDSANAVLAEFFATGGTTHFRLTKQRIRTNLDTPALVRGLPYYPREARLHSGVDLFRVLVKNVYGDRPDVAVRELVQNAVDAVHLLRTRQHGLLDDPGARLPIQVVVREGANGAHSLTVSDPGCGMTPGAVANYFLTAGASFRPEPHVQSDGSPPRPVLKAGRFGVGAHASFLLGPQVDVRTRHYREDRGVRFTVRNSDDLVELRWDASAPVGTEIRIDFHMDESQLHSFLARLTEWYAYEDPPVQYVHVDPDRVSHELPHRNSVPAHEADLPPDWRECFLEGSVRAAWRTIARSESDRGKLAINGIWIGERGALSENSWKWSDDTGLIAPMLSVSDLRGELDLRLDRFGILRPVLPFEEELAGAIGRDVVAHALVRGARPHPLRNDFATEPIWTNTGWLPLLPAIVWAQGIERILLVWHSEATVNEAGATASGIGDAWTIMPTANSPNDMQASARLMMRAAGGTSHTTVVAFKQEPIAKGKRWRAPQRYQRWRKMGAARDASTDRDGRYALVTTHGVRNVALNRLLIERARERLESVPFVALTVIHGVAPAGRLGSLIGEAWKSYIGGALDETTAPVPAAELAPYISGWEAAAASREWAWRALDRSRDPGARQLRDAARNGSGESRRV